MGFSVSAPQASTGGLFGRPSFGSTMNTAMDGYANGRKLGEDDKALKVKAALRELMQRHDITTPQGKRALVQELSQSGLGEAAMSLHQDMGGNQQQLVDTPQGYQSATPSYGTSGLMSGPGGAPVQSQTNTNRISEQELAEGFQAWHDAIAKPFGEARGFKLSQGDINRLRSTLPRELQSAKVTDDFFRTVKPEPQTKPPAAGGKGSGYSPGGITRNIEDIDSELSEAQGFLADLEGKNGLGPTESKQAFDLRRKVSRLKEERRKYQSRVPAMGRGKGKLSDPAKAREYLDRAGGDANKARELAKREGWTF